MHACLSIGGLNKGEYRAEQIQYCTDQQKFREITVSFCQKMDKVD